MDKEIYIALADVHNETQNIRRHLDHIYARLGALEKAHTTPPKTKIEMIRADCIECPAYCETEISQAYMITDWICAHAGRTGHKCRLTVSTK